MMSESNKSVKALQYSSVASDTFIFLIFMFIPAVTLCENHRNELIEGHDSKKSSVALLSHEGIYTSSSFNRFNTATGDPNRCLVWFKRSIE